MTTHLTEIDDARRLILQSVRPLAHETVGLDDALRRVLARDVVCVDPVPSFDNSAMDGFAVRSGDLRDADPRSPVQLVVVGESRAGHPAEVVMRAGEAIAISTGAMMPQGADAVVAVERTRTRNGRVEVLAAAQAGADVRYIAEDSHPGETALRAGTVLDAAHLGVAATLGRDRVTCFKRPRVSVLCTGDELVALGETLRPGSIYDSNAHSIPALARLAGAEVVATATVADDPETTRETIELALQGGDVTVICGGISVGAHDHVKPSLAALGVGEHFWGVSLKPGKPTWFGTRGEHLVFGLPGNPVSAMVTFTLFAAPALRALSGTAQPRRRSSATLTEDYPKQPGRAHAVRCRLRPGDGGWLADPTGPQDSHILTSMLDADALAIIPTAQASVTAGERVAIELLDDRWPVCP